MVARFHMLSGLSALRPFPKVHPSSFSPLSCFHGIYVSRWYVRLAAEIAQGVVVLPRSPLQVFVRLEESTVAHCPSLSPVSAPFPRNARHFLPFLSPSVPSPVPSSLFLSCYSLRVCTLAVCSLFRSFGPRKYHLPPPPILSNHGRSFIRETDDPKGIF